MVTLVASHTHHGISCVNSIQKGVAMSDYFVN